MTIGIFARLQLQLLSIRRGLNRNGVRESPSSQIKISSADWLPVKFPCSANVLWIWCRLAIQGWLMVASSVYGFFVALERENVSSFFLLSNPQAPIEEADRVCCQKWSAVTVTWPFIEGNKIDSPNIWVSSSLSTVTKNESQCFT